MDVDTRLLRSFAAVAAEGSLSRAAERLFVSQPALTKQIKQLESQLGVQLFTRSRAGDRKSTRLNSSHTVTSYAVFCLNKKKPPSRTSRQSATPAAPTRIPARASLASSTASGSR